MFTIRRRWGKEEEDVPESEFSAVIAELRNADVEHGEVCLQHESEWVLAYYRTGILVFQNVERGEPQHMKGVSPAKVLDLWRKLAKGEIGAIASEAWLPGHE